MERRRYLTGSRAFFDGMAGFDPHDTDVVEFEPRQLPPCIHATHDGVSLFRWKHDTADALIAHLLQWPDPAMQVCLMLVPDIAERVGMTADRLPQLQPLIDNLDPRHRYLAVIFEAYLENGGFTLTDEQRHAAFENYKEARHG